MYSLGVDVGSVSTDFVLTDENRKIIESLYLRTHGDPAGTVARQNAGGQHSGSRCGEK